MASKRGNTMHPRPLTVDQGGDLTSDDLYLYAVLCLDNLMTPRPNNKVLCLEYEAARMKLSRETVQLSFGKLVMMGLLDVHVTTYDASHWGGKNHDD